MNEYLRMFGANFDWVPVQQWGRPEHLIAVG